MMLLEIAIMMAEVIIEIAIRVTLKDLEYMTPL